MAAARAQPIPVFAEMSSINPVVLLPAALKKRGEAVADELSASVVLGCGQFCTNPGLVIGIRSAQFSAFLERFAARMDDQPAQTMLNAGTLASYEKGLAALHAHPHVRHLAGQPQEGRQARPQLFQADVSLLLEGDELLQEEVFGPASVVVEVADHAELKRALHGLHGQLTATLIAEAEDLASFADLVPLLEQKAGRLLLNGYPTGVEVCDAMVHGGPYPATSDARGTSVGTLAIDRFLRPVCYQNYPDAWLPESAEGWQPIGDCAVGGRDRDAGGGCLKGVPGRARSRAERDLAGAEKPERCAAGRGERAESISRCCCPGVHDATDARRRIRQSDRKESCPAGRTGRHDWRPERSAAPLALRQRRRRSR